MTAIETEEELSEEMQDMIDTCNSISQEAEDALGEAAGYVQGLQELLEKEVGDAMYDLAVVIKGMSPEMIPTPDYEYDQDLLDDMSMVIDDIQRKAQEAEDAGRDIYYGLEKKVEEVRELIGRARAHG